MLLAYGWPGNVRELENMMERVAILCDAAVEPDDLADHRAAEPPRRRVHAWKDIERQAIEDALRVNDGNRTRAAKQLGISLRTLQYRLKEYGMPSQIYEAAFSGAGPRPAAASQAARRRRAGCPPQPERLPHFFSGGDGGVRAGGVPLRPVGHRPGARSVRSR